MTDVRKSSGSGGDTSAAFSGDKIPVLKETAVIEKHVATTGRVRVSTHTQVVEETVSATLQGEEVEISRIPVNKVVSGELPKIRIEGETTIVPVFEEVLVMEKRLMLKEELHIRSRQTSERVEMKTPLRKQEAIVERPE